ncbi:MAG TPA: SOS response-associated peptidase family protein [Candidatus Thermoplasmatota archaeon]|nr:SOS response-associated peptidase family protein [Candidatus Thermoplasmatota archaeon]
MAGLIGLQAADIEVQDALGSTRWAYDGWVPHPVVRLTTSMPVAVAAPEGRTVVKARWGFPVGPRPVGNARDDKLRASPLWSGMLQDGRALAVATGVYEMADVGGRRQALWFRRIDGRPIVMPALVADRGIKGGQRLCAAIVTTQPNAFFGRFHDRQVCELDALQATAWLHAASVEDALALLAAPPEEAWEAVPVDGRIFRPGRVEAEHLVQVAPALRPDGAPPAPRDAWGTAAGTRVPVAQPAPGEPVPARKGQGGRQLTLGDM